MSASVLQAIERVQRFNADKEDAWALPPEPGQFVHALILVPVENGLERSEKVASRIGW